MHDKDIEIFCLDGPNRPSALKIQSFPRIRFFSSFGISPRIALEFHRILNELEIVHQHSLWTMPNILIGWIVPGSTAKLVTSPHGTLSAWALNRRKILKQILWPLQKRALSRADLIHVTSESELRQVRNLGVNVPTALIPLGIDLPTLLTDSHEADGERKLLFLSRIHPIKGIELLLEAWKILQFQHPKWRLIIAGTGEEEYLSRIKRKAQALGLSRIEFTGELLGIDKNSAYQSADLFVLPSYSENFGFVVAEALANGCPTVVSRGAPWSMLDKEGCGWWIENNVPSLAATLGGAMNLPRQELRRMGLLGRAWIERDFSWEATASKMSLAYHWLTHGGEKPEWVSLSN
jgi:glycosyltransferase involved in cell wall biosynthesis